jgi:hypothetical protein
MSGRPRMTARKRILFAAIAVSLTFVAAFLVLLGVDIYLHGNPAIGRRQRVGISRTGRRA